MVLRYAVTLQVSIHPYVSLFAKVIVICFNVTLRVHTCSGRNRTIHLMRRPNTDDTPNKPVTLPRNQLLIRYACTSLVHTVTIRCYETR